MNTKIAKSIFIFLIMLSTCAQLCSCDSAPVDAEPSATSSSAVTPTSAHPESATTEPVTVPVTGPVLNDEIWGAWNNGGGALFYFDSGNSTFDVYAYQYSTIVHFATGTYRVTLGNDFPYKIELEGTTLEDNELFEMSFGCNESLMRSDDGYTITKLNTAQSIVNTIIGSWQVFGTDEFCLYDGWDSARASAIAFYNDGTFKVDTGDYGTYSTMFDGDAIQMFHSGFGYVPYSIHFFNNNLISLSSEYGEYLFYRVD